MHILCDNFAFSFSILLIIPACHNFDCICKHIANVVFIYDVLMKLFIESIMHIIKKLYTYVYV